MDVREINDLDGVFDLRQCWRGLLAQTPRASFFQTPDWLAAYWRHAGAGQRLRVLVVEDDGAPVGIVPLVVRRESTKVGRLRYLTYPLDYWGSFYGPIGADPDRTLAGAIDYLSDTGSGADILELRWVGDEDDECGRFEQLLSDGGESPQRTPIDSTAVIDLGGGWDAYLASRKSKWRNNLKRWRRRTAELGEVEHVRYRPEGDADSDPRWDLYDECLRIATSSWQGSSTSGTTLTHEAVADFLRDTHRAAAASGGLDLNLLLVNGRAVAFAYNYVFAGNVFGLRVGYDPAVRDSGAGGLLYAMAIEDSFRRGDWRYDLGPRHLDIKRPLLTRELMAYRITCCKTWSVRQQLLSLKRLWDARNTPVVAEAKL